MQVIQSGAACDRFPASVHLRNSSTELVKAQMSKDRTLEARIPFELFRLLLCVVVGDRPREVRLVDAAVADGMFGD